MKRETFTERYLLRELKNFWLARRHSVNFISKKRLRGQNRNTRRRSKSNSQRLLSCYLIALLIY